MYQNQYNRTPQNKKDNQNLINNSLVSSPYSSPDHRKDKIIYDLENRYDDFLRKIHCFYEEILAHDSIKDVKNT